MSKVSLNNVPSNPRISRLRTYSRTESETSCEEAARLTVEQQEEEDDGYDYHEIPPPPDGGYGWVVVFASFMCNLVVDGIAYTFGIFLPELVEYFGEGKGTVAWVGSLLSGVYLAAGECFVFGVGLYVSSYIWGSIVKSKRSN